MRANRELRNIFLASLLLTLGGCIGTPIDYKQGDEPAYREYTTGSNIGRRERGVPGDVRQYGKGDAEALVDQASQVTSTPEPKAR